ncbi:MAG: pyridoxamine 5'-phosphate oxidase family protein [Flavobacteriaceae bacterium]
MGKKLYELTPELIDFIENQQLFFVATAMNEGKINLSPKGLDSFKVLDDNTVLWLNLTGSGNETAAHMQRDNRMTIMFCAFEGKPLILRLYGTAKIYHKGTGFWKKHIDSFLAIAGGRQLVKMKIDMVQISCGMGVPVLEYKQQREELVTWAEMQGNKGIENYWKQKNILSLDGHSIDAKRKV